MSNLTDLVGSVATANLAAEGIADQRRRYQQALRRLSPEARRQVVRIGRWSIALTLVFVLGYLAGGLLLMHWLIVSEPALSSGLVMSIIIGYVIGVMIVFVAALPYINRRFVAPELQLQYDKAETGISDEALLARYKVYRRQYRMRILAWCLLGAIALPLLEIYLLLSVFQISDLIAFTVFLITPLGTIFWFAKSEPSRRDRLFTPDERRLVERADNG